MTYTQLRRAGAAATIGTITGSFIFLALAAMLKTDLFMQQRLWVGCVAAATGLVGIFAHFWRPPY